MTSTASLPRNVASAAATRAGSAPGSRTDQCEPVRRSASAPVGATHTSTTSRPVGRAASSASRTRSGSQGVVSPISQYSASLAAPVAQAFAYEIRGCGEKPEE